MDTFGNRKLTECSTNNLPGLRRQGAISLTDGFLFASNTGTAFKKKKSFCYTQKLL